MTLKLFTFAIFAATHAPATRPLSEIVAPDFDTLSTEEQNLAERTGVGSTYFDTDLQVEVAMGDDDFIGLRHDVRAPYPELGASAEFEGQGYRGTVSNIAEADGSAALSTEITVDPTALDKELLELAGLRGELTGFATVRTTRVYRADSADNARAIVHSCEYDATELDLSLSDATGQRLDVQTRQRWDWCREESLDSETSPDEFLQKLLARYEFGGSARLDGRAIDLGPLFKSQLEWTWRQ